MDDNIVGGFCQNNRDEEEDSSIQHYCLPMEPPPPSTLITHSCKHKLFLLLLLQQFTLTIPRQIITLDEKYLRHCLHSIHMTANDSTTSPLLAAAASTCHALFLFSSTQQNAVKGSYMNNPIVGSITGSTSIINLLNSSLLCHLPTSNHHNPSAVEVRESLPVASSQRTQMKTIPPEHHIYGCNPVHKRLVSVSSTNSTFSDTSSSSSSSSSSSAYCQGMLHCSWNNGFPCYVFSVEDQKQVYTAHLSKIGSDYMYKFYSRAGKKEIQFLDQESDLIGKMRVSTSFTPGTEIMETQFILWGTDHHSEGGTINQTVKKSKGLTKKVSNIFRGHHIRRKTSSMFDGSVAIEDNCLESSEEGNISSESSIPSNLELAAIVLKDHIPYTQKKVEVGGWGLKFLKESGLKQKFAAQSVPCRQNVSHESSSMDVIVPAGIHGGPRTETGGPSSLVERWRSGGSCDCGGWDIGCPLTILNAGPNNKEALYQVGVFGRSNSFELFTQGSKQSLPVIELANVHDGLYYIHYQPTLSALQSLSIAVAIIHSHSPILKPKVYRN